VVVSEMGSFHNETIKIAFLKSQSRNKRTEDY
jgi:hypothetical protein